jgi:hypothetical protein
MPRRRKPPRAGALTELQPLKIATQIATLQALYYMMAGVLMLFTTLVAGMGFSMDMILGWDAVRGDTTQGWLLSLVWLIDGGFCMYVVPGHQKKKNTTVVGLLLTCLQGPSPSLCSSREANSCPISP